MAPPSGKPACLIPTTVARLAAGNQTSTPLVEVGFTAP